MPGRSTSSSGSTGFISFSGVESALSSLKNFQSCISSGMDTAYSVALGLVETQTEVKEERPEEIPDLKLLVEEKFSALQNKNSDADFQNNEKFTQFKQQLKELKKQSVKPKEDGGHNDFDQIKDKDASRAGNGRDGLQADREADGTEGVDEDMIVTQSQTNFICPITQLEMKKPVKNKVCGHTYEEEAIVRMIESKHRRKKKACCPKIGCSHTDVRMSDLIQDEVLRRAIESHKKKRRQSD
uniref:E3 SUMO-protein ligase NSE2 n=1 Tax=Tursiops truncatus TaxID=9739 RepID=A0A6J3Q8G2_TURTR|nr:E3 SUMO-protein ligase NSE2 isoform X4 [Tursiops truncatus]